MTCCLKHQEEIERKDAELQVYIDVNRQNSALYESLQAARDKERVINELLRLSLADMCCNELLVKAIDIIVSAQWGVLPLIKKGGIFIINEDKEDELELVAHKNLAANMLVSSAQAIFKKCSCSGSVMESRATNISDQDNLIDDGDEVYHTEYCCLPIKIRSVIIGVLILYPEERNPLCDQKVEFLESVASIISSIIRNEKYKQRLRYMIGHDTLTGLPNRGLFEDRLSQAIKTASRQQYDLALLAIDLDKFKQVNDSFGHSVGDKLLRAVAERMLGCIRTSDTIAKNNEGSSDTLARLGGDEFTVILPCVKGKENAAVVAEKIIKELTREFLLSSHRIDIGCSIGIAMYPEDFKQASCLCESADEMMYKAKAAGRGTYRFYGD